jgi:hypothetical protein
MSDTDIEYINDISNGSNEAQYPDNAQRQLI